MYNKWNRAQELELMNWRRKKDTLSFDSTYLQNRADIIRVMIQQFTKINNNTKILEIGGAGMPVIDYVEGSVKFGLDPLAHHYKEFFKNSYNHEVQYLSSQAENIPFRDNEFDVVISLNVIDHVMTPTKMLEEVYRIMKYEGILILSVDTYSRLINFLRNIRIHLGWKRLNDELHPHHFTLRGIFKLLCSKFEPLSVFNSVLDPVSMGRKRGYPVKSGVITRIRNEQRFYFIGKKISNQKCT